MSAKYRRVKQADLKLPAPLRWLTRAFSSITLAVILLTGIAIYGMLETVPLIFMTLGGLYALAILATFGPAALATWWLVRRRVGRLLKLTGVAGLFGGAALAAWQLSVAGYWWVYENPWLTENRAMTVNRLPALEMTSQEFYAWWPMQLMLILFVINMVWATIRRIEFKFVNIGVLTVHAGIVVIALGSILYGHFKVEGDTILFRQDLGGGFESVFYDASEPALYLEQDDRELMFALPDLPRFNDYDLGDLDISLHRRPEFAEHLGDRVRMTIPGYIAYGELTERWAAPDDLDTVAAATRASPALRLAFAGRERPDPDAGEDEGVERITLAADLPAQRVIEEPGWAIEYLVGASERRLRDLNSEITGEHGLVVEIPEHDLREVHAIEPGQTIELEDAGYTLEIHDVGPYDIPFVTDGYENATDTRAVVRVRGPDTDFTRFVLHRYPERSQDFVNTDGDDAEPITDESAAGTGAAMGDRRDPDESIHLAYLDNTRTQYHLVAEEPDAPLELIARFPGGHRLWIDAPREGLPLTSPTAENPLFFHIERQFPQAVNVIEPEPTPRAQREPEDEGHHLQALLPVEIEVDLPEAEGGGTWRRLVWLRNMRYPRYGDAQRRPVTVQIPTVGQVNLAFSRLRHQLPFAMALVDFEMMPYPGSDIPADFESRVLIGDVTADGRMFQQPEEHRVHLNNPIMYRSSTAPLHLRRVKISQNAWDPPAEGDPEAEARDAEGRFLNQQRFTVLGIGNNVGIHIIAIGGIMMVLGIPWAFYIKPILVRREKRKIQQRLVEQQQRRQGQPTPPPGPEPSAEPEPAQKRKPGEKPVTV